MEKQIYHADVQLYILDRRVHLFQSLIISVTIICVRTTQPARTLKQITPAYVHLGTPDTFVKVCVFSLITPRNHVRMLHLSSSD